MQRRFLQRAACAPRQLTKVVSSKGMHRSLSTIAATTAWRQTNDQHQWNSSAWMIGAGSLAVAGVVTTSVAMADAPAVDYQAVRWCCRRSSSRIIHY